jgi:hypothetical protein
LTGFIAWLGLWQYRYLSRTPRWSVAGVLLASILTFAAMSRAANIGGEIRHPEIVANAAPPPAEDAPAGIARSIGMFVNAHEWFWPSCETLHFVGLSMLFTTVLMLDLRVLGVAKKLSFASLYQLLPLGMLGFALNMVTGWMFFLATPEQYTMNPVNSINAKPNRAASSCARMVAMETPSGQPNSGPEQSFSTAALPLR